MTGVVFATIVHDILQMIYLAPRPYWEDPRILMKEHTCPKDYGSPSFHALMSMTWAFMIYFDLRGSGKCRSLALVGVPAVYTVGLGYSRLVVGVHSVH